MTPAEYRDRRVARTSGMIAVGLALGLTELAAGSLGGVPSLVAAVADRLVDATPGAVDRAVIALLGTSDKPALVAGVVVASLFVGSRTGGAAVTRPWIGPAAFAALAVLGVAAAAAEPNAHVVVTLVATVLSATVGAGALAVLLRVGVQAPHIATIDGEAEVVRAHTRRQFLGLAGGITLIAVAAAATGRLLAGHAASVARSLISLPRPQRPAPPPPPGASLSVPGISPLVSSNDSFYRVDTAIITPQLETVSWTLRIFGLVDHPFEISFPDLLNMPMVEEYVTLTCVSNEVGGDLVGNARWLGVPVADLLDRAGVHRGADQLVGRAVDGFTVGIPTAAVLDGRVALVAVGMNGDPLPFEHGFPARLVVAGLYGYVSATKWLTELQLTTFPAFDAFWVERGWAQQAPIKTESRIDVPQDGQTIAAGSTTIAGVAWAQTRGISRVEVRVDDGTWNPAMLADAIGPNSWRQWLLPWDARAGSHTLAVRATDGHGVTQTSAIAPPAPDGATGYHTITVQAGG